MENATKALLMGAGMLFAMVIVSFMVYGYVQIKSYYGEKQNSTTKEQITAFNLEYEAYNREDVTGFELVSLINKIINYNAQNALDESLGFNNTDKNWTKMYIGFTITDSNITNGLTKKTDKAPDESTNKGSKVKLFSKSTYDSEHPKTEEELEQNIEKMQGLENKYTAAVLSKLVSNRDNLAIYGGSGSKDIKIVLGKEVADDKLPTEEEVLKYSQYIDFKRATFRCTATEYNNSTGRITKLTFIQN